MEILQHSASEEESQSLVSRQLDSDQIDLLAPSSGLAVLDLEKQAPTKAAAKNMDHLIRCLYGSHFLSRWGDRMWEFAVGLFMIQVWPDSLLLVAVYGLVEAASMACLGVVVGELVDKWPRLRVVQVSLAVQNVSVGAAAVAIVVLLLHPGSAPGGFSIFVLLVIIVNVFGATSALAGLAMDVVVERDWVVSIANQQPPGFLTRINAVMRRIDLSCKLLAPVAVGIMMSFVSVLASAILITVWNVACVGFEFWLLHHVYMAMPVLHHKKLPTGVLDSQNTAIKPSNENENSSALEMAEVLQVEDIQNQETGLLQGKGVRISRKFSLVEKLKHLPVIEGWTMYMHQEAMLAGLALALLYFTVLSFGSFMTAVLNWRGIPPYILGLARGLAAIVGIFATVIYPIIHARIQTVRTGIWSIWIQCSLLSVSVASIWVQNSRVASIMLISGVAASRLGLWMFDLSVTQLMQETVPEAERGVVGGVQKSLQSLMDMLTYVVGMVIVHPEDFGISICMSFISVLIAAVLYSLHVYRVRGHLFHFDRLLHSR